MGTADADYLEAIVRHFVGRRGRGLLLASADLELIAGWERAGIPLAAVLRGIDEAFRRRPGGEIRSLGQCQWAIEAEGARVRVVGFEGNRPMLTQEEIEKKLQTLAAALDRAAQDVADPPMREALAAAADKVRVLAVAPGTNAGARLKTVESELLDALSASLAPEEMAALDVATARGAHEEDARGSAREEALRVKLRETVRGLFDLPDFRIGP